MKKVDRINIALSNWSLVISLLALAISAYFAFQAHVYVQKQIALEKESLDSKVVAQIEIDYVQKEVLFKKLIGMTPKPFISKNIFWY